MGYAPGPVNRGVEIADSVMSYERCLINRQLKWNCNKNGCSLLVETNDFRK